MEVAPSLEWLSMALHDRALHQRLELRNNDTKFPVAELAKRAQRAEAYPVSEETGAAEETETGAAVPAGDYPSDGDYPKNTASGNFIMKAVQPAYKVLSVMHGVLGALGEEMHIVEHPLEDVELPLQNTMWWDPSAGPNP